ncbi:MAG: Ig-like domain-containing protein [Actinomycetota bacterium]|nr:Ig-like domain-containing protein [Actinomycetota bacterium]
MGGNFCRPRVLVAAGLFALTAVGVTAAPAAAATVTATCDVFNLDAAGIPTGTALVEDLPFEVTLPTLAGPPEVFAGATYDVGGTPDNVVLPTSTASSFGPVNIIEVKNITLGITTTGAAAIGSPALAGGGVIGPAATIVGGNTLQLVFPGSQGGSAFAITGDAYFPGGSTFTPPAVSLPITAGAVGTTISGSLTAFQVDTRILVVNLAATLNVRLLCTVPPNTLGSVEVVAPPLPGAPSAVSDVATTNAGAAVVIDVLANDTPNADIGIDPASLKLTSTPANGGAALAAGKVTYAPNPGFSGTDTFTYELCSLPDPDTAAAGTCDSATVTVTVVAPVVAAQATTTTVAPTTTTSAPAAAAQLPVTGRSSAPLAAVGLTAAIAGAALLFHSRARRLGDGA